MTRGQRVGAAACVLVLVVALGRILSDARASFDGVGGALTAFLVAAAGLSAIMTRLLVTEVADHQRSETDRLESERRYQRIFECVPLPMWILDRETLTFLTVNHAGLRKDGYCEKDFSGRTTSRVLPPV